VSDWEKVRREYSEKIDEFLDQPVEFRIPHIAIAPITGAIENIGFADERNYYAEIVAASKNVGIGLCIGDGYPDEKLKFGIEAIRGVESTAAVFIKPYENHRIIERIGWSSEIASIIGIDIDSYNILTMRNMVNLEKKSAEQLMEIQDFVHDKLGLPFAIKGIFTEDDIKLVEQVQPDIAYISNHGGRVDTREGSTAEFLAAYAEKLRANCGELWVDGGIRSRHDMAVAAAYGVSTVLEGRPFITALCRERA
jgi:isopentenyl diphosphate isomerase/L-lactate dehydrogenase-like FMN-dependent dehydrogenase